MTNEAFRLLDEFTVGYILEALHQTHDKKGSIGERYDITDIQDSVIQQMIDDCASFKKNCEEYLKSEFCGYTPAPWLSLESLWGKDFWTSRYQFWSTQGFMSWRNREVALKLHKASEDMGAFILGVQDGEIYLKEVMMERDIYHKFV